jgi:hypothetical protein
MRKYCTFLFLFSLVSVLVKAQGLVPSLVENTYLLDTQTGGTARYRALGGAMTALGGDLSAVGDNPAGLGIYTTSEFVVSLGVNTTNNEVPSIVGERLATRESDTRLKFNQIGGVLVFEIPDTQWKSFAIGINSQNIGAINQTISVGRDTGVELVPEPDPRTFNGYFSEIRGYNYRTNISFAGNYDNNLYIGGSLDFYNSNKEITNIFYEESVGSFYNYVKDNSPMSENGTGFGLSLGLIYKPIQEVRLGLSYKSPIWSSIDREIPNYQYDDNDNRYYLTNYDVYTYDTTTPATVNVGAAYVFGKKGLLSVDYSLRDYRGMQIRPNANFQLENQLVNNVFQSTSAVKIGTEYRLNETFTFRGGFSYQQSPIDLDKLTNYDDTTGYSMSYYGDTKGFSGGLGLKLGQSTYLDFAYNYLTRDRQFFISGEHYDLISNEPNESYLVSDFFPGITVLNIKEINHHISFTLGFKF